MRIDPHEFLKIVRPALEAGDPARLAEEVCQRWTPRQLCELLRHADADIRRVTAVTIGLVGDDTCIGCLIRALHDADEGVNQMAEHGLWAIWFRSGQPAAAKPFSEGVSLLCQEKYAEAMAKFERAIRLDPEFAEAFNQCAIAHFFMGQWEASIEDCRRALALMPSHFGAMSGMGHCHTHLGNLDEALRCYRESVRINPRMTAIADAIERLEANMGNRNDSSGMFEATGLRR